MNELRVTTVQSHLTWENREANLENLDRLLEQVPPTDIIVLPETFTSAFSMEPRRFAEDWKEADTPTVKWMDNWADKTGAAVTGSIVVKEQGEFFNRLVWVEPGAIMRQYDKRHLFTMAGEDRFYSQGIERVVISYKDWEICPMICYDLRFPLWSRNSVESGEPLFDVLLYVANWPEPRVNAWIDLLRARAIENQVYTVGVNRIGSDENGRTYTGDSMVVDFKGIEMTHHPRGEEGIRTTVLKYDELREFREKFPVLNDADAFFIK